MKLIEKTPSPAWPSPEGRLRRWVLMLDKTAHSSSHEHAAVRL